MIQVDFRPYTTAIRTSAVHARPLSRELRKAAPKSLTKEPNAALAGIEELADSIQIVLDDRDRASGPAIRPYLDPCLASWHGMIGGLESKARLPREVSDSGKQAEEILAAYFPDDTAFTRLDARGFWSEAQRRIDRMEREGDVKRITNLIGDDVFDAAKKTTAALGEVLNVGKSIREPAPSRDALREVMGRFSRALGKYGRLMAARVDEEDEASVAEFLKAMAPIDEYRSVRGSGEEEDVEEPSPAPDDAPQGESPTPGDSPT